VSGYAAAPALRLSAVTAFLSSATFYFQVSMNVADSAATVDVKIRL
jgi:hypothetical protein